MVSSPWPLFLNKPKEESVSLVKSDKRITVFGLWQDRYRIVEDCSDWLCQADIRRIEDAPKTVDCIVVEHICGQVEIRFTTRKNKK